MGEAAAGNLDKEFQSLRKAKIDKAVHDVCLLPCLAQIGGVAGEKPVEWEMIKDEQEMAACVVKREACSAAGRRSPLAGSRIRCFRRVLVQ